MVRREVIPSGRGGGGKGGGGSGRVAQEAPNTLRSRATAKFIDVLSEGPIEGLVDGERSIFFDNTPLQAADDSYNFTGVSYALMAGLPDQAPIPGITATETETPVGVRVLEATPVVRSIVSADATSARVTVRVPSLSRQDTTNGDLLPTAVDIAIDVRVGAGGWQEVVAETISGKTTSTYERAFRVPLPAGPGTRDFRMRRITPDSASAALQNETWLASFTEIIERRLIYPDCAAVGMAADSSLFGGQVASRAYEVFGIQCQIPDNYDPETRVYTGIWAGTFQVAWTDNPAWVLYDVLTNPRYGLGGKIAASSVDKWALYEIAQYCDELVPDGFGGLEPRFTFNFVIADREDAYRVLNSIASSFRGMLYWGAGTVTVVADMPADPVALLGAANVIEGRFSYSGTALKARHNRAIVSWNDPADGYRRALEVVEDLDAIATVGLRVAEITAVGCTSQGQANREGRWLLDSEKNQTETVTFRCGLDQFTLRPGNIISVQDPAWAGLRRAGRIVAATAGTITVDQSLVLTTGVAYELSVVLPTGEVERRAVTTSPGAATAIDVSPAFSEAPIVGAIWLLSGADAAPRQFRVMAVVETEPHLLEVTALLHDPTKYARIELGLALTAPAFTAFPTGQIKRPSDITVRKVVARVDSAIVSLVVVSWRGALDGRVAKYEVEYRPTGLGWQPGGTTRGVSIDVPAVQPGVYDFRVRSLDALGGFSTWQQLTGVDIDAALGISDVQNPRLSILAVAATLSWDPVRDVNLSHYVVKHSPAQIGAEWASAVLLVPITESTAVNVPTMAGTYLVKAVSTAGDESAIEAAVVTAVTGDDDLNAVAAAVQQPTFTGTKTTCQVVSGGLEITPASGVVPTSATYLFALTGGASVDLGDVYTSRVSGLIEAVGVQIDNNVFSWPNVYEQPNVYGSANDLWGVELQERHTDGNPAGSPTWTAWAPLVVGDITARAYQFRALLSSRAGNVTPRVTKLEAFVDMPDRIASERGLAVGTGGATITFAPAFKETPSIVVTPRDLGNAERVNVTGATTAGFTVQILDSSGAGVARTIDWHAIGYGYKQ
jgi:predicted phage tail protein